MGGKHSVSSKKKMNEKGISHYSLLSIIRDVLERHGGSIDVDENAKAIVFKIPAEKKAACYAELGGMLDAVKAFVCLCPANH
jgi:hypothetical protein